MSFFTALANGMASRFKIVAGVLGLGALAVGVDLGYRSMYYEQTDARLISVKVDCYIEGGRDKIVEKESGDLAYMDCGLAPLAAKEFGHAKTDIKRRARLKYEYRSPADGTRQLGTYTQLNAPKYSVGQRLQVYAHTSIPDKSRFN